MAQKRRSEMRRRQLRRRRHAVTALCIAGGIGAVALSVIVCLLVFDVGAPDAPSAFTDAAMTPAYDASQPFTAADLSAAQLGEVLEQGRVSVSDGPRGISVGDTLDALLERFPSSFSGEQPEDEQILYCADYFANRSGKMVALPPRGLLTADSSAIYVTLLAPVSAYPAGTADNYGDFEHIYCRFTIEPDSMTVSAITLGVER